MRNEGESTHAPTPVPPAARLLAVLFVILCIAWILYWPYRPELLYRALPEQSVLAMDHVRLAEAWSRDLTNAVVRGVAQSWGAPDPGRLGENRVARNIVRLFTGDLSVTGLAQFTARVYTPAIFGASWVGGPRAALYRLLLRVRWVPGLGRLGVSEYGTRYWRPPDDRDWPGAVVSFEIFQGVLLAAWSQDQDAVRGMSWRLDHGASLAGVFGAEEPWRDSPGIYPHRAWIGESLTDRTAMAGIGGIALTLVALDGGGATLRARTDRLPGGYRLEALPDPRLPGFVPDDAPALIALGPIEKLAVLLGRLIPASDIGSRLLEAPGGGEPAWFWLTGAPYEGRLLGVRTPALFVAVPAGTEPDRESVGVALDEINAIWRMGLTHRPGAHGEEILIDSSLLGLGDLWRRDDQCGMVAFHAGWRVAGTSVHGWRRQLRSGRTPSIRDHADWRSWMESAGADGNAIAAVWVNPGRLAQELRNAIAVYRLISRFVNIGHDASDILEYAVVTVAALEGMSAFGPLVARVFTEPGAEGPAVELRLGAHLNLEGAVEPGE